MGIRGYYTNSKVVYGNLDSVLCGRNILLQIPKPLPIKEKSRVLGCQTLNFAYAAFASPLTWGKLV